MTIDYEALLHRQFADVIQTYSAKDCILYALGIGLGSDPTDHDQLRYVYEEGLQMLPTMPVVLGHPGFWLRSKDTGVTWQSVVHGEQGLTIHRGLAGSGSVTGKTTIEAIVDKGVGRSAFLYTRRDLYDNADGTLVSTLRSTVVCRADGGFGGPTGSKAAASPLPARAPDFSHDFPTLPQAALIYRLSGDYNPLHADPSVAKSAGFAQPILHGLCTFGVAAYALTRLVAGGDGTRLRRFDARFSAPVYPGDILRTDVWVGEPEGLRFRCAVAARDALVLDRGIATLQ